MLIFQGVDFSPIQLERFRTVRAGFASTDDNGRSQLWSEWSGGACLRIGVLWSPFLKPPWNRLWRLSVTFMTFILWKWRGFLHTNVNVPNKSNTFCFCLPCASNSNFYTWVCLKRWARQSLEISWCYRRSRDFSVCLCIGLNLLFTCTVTPFCLNTPMVPLIMFICVRKAVALDINLGWCRPKREF